MTHFEWFDKEKELWFDGKPWLPNDYAYFTIQTQYWQGWMVYCCCRIWNILRLRIDGKLWITYGNITFYHWFCCSLDLCGNLLFPFIKTKSYHNFPSFLCCYNFYLELLDFDGKVWLNSEKTNFTIICHHFAYYLNFTLLVLDGKLWFNNQ